MSVANVSSDYGNVDVEIFRLVGAPRPHHLRVNIVSCQGNVTLTLPKFFEGTVVIPNDRTMRMKRSPVVCTPGALGRVYKGYIRFETRDPELDGEEDVVYIRAHGKIRVKLADDAGQKRPLWEMWRGTKWVRLRPSS
ncbi:hypothetical protein PLICRDRAFT_160545 [Plicaturopsis crispa FD-325 SS-3]|nr:hypothetical protein PLICRDRAFT_160545 [Plicaturopsis crispa FD-325 SS-3]